MQALWEQVVRNLHSEYGGRIPALAIYDGRFFLARDNKHTSCVHGNLAKYGAACVECQVMTWKLGGLL